MSQPSEKPDKIDGHSLDLRSQRLAAMKALLPEAFDFDGNLVRDKLIEALQPSAQEDTDDIPSFGLGWPGKQRAFAAAGVPTTATLRPCPEQSIDFDTTQNLLLEGDNLEVLKTLQRSYHGKIKMVYIDPPYNTGKDFVYPDNYGEELDIYLQRTQQKDEDGFWKSTNNETSGRKHANWLGMMAPRLMLARNLLCDDGVIFISIDENEVTNLRLLCDEIFGAENFVALLTIQCNPRGRAQDKHFASTHEYALCYSSSVLPKGSFEVDKDQSQIEREYPERDKYGQYRLLELRNTHREFGRHNRPNLFYPLYVADDGTVSVEKKDGRLEILPLWDDGFEGCWTWGLPKATENIELLHAKKVGSRQKIYVKDRADGATRMLKTILLDKNYATDKGQRTFNELFGSSEKIFQSPKSPFLLADLIKTSTKESDIILDFFAGSGTTGHAVLAQNAEDGGNRKYICVQLPEPLDEPVTLDDSVVCETIFDLTRERLKRAGQKIKEEAGLNAENLDTGLRVFKLDSSNFTAWNSDPTTRESDLLDRLDQLTDQTLPGRSETDILWEILLKMGLPLDLQLERFEVAGASFIGIGDRTKVISTETEIPTAAMEALLDQEVPPSELVVLDGAFEDDTARANIATMYKQRKDDDGKPICNLRVV